MPRDPRVAGAVRAPLTVPNSTAAVEAALQRPSDCVPVGGVMLSMANPHHRPLRAAQFARIRNVGCLMDRLVSICWGFADDGFGTCVKGECASSHDGRVTKDSACVPSDYRRSQYVSLNWAKWPFFIDALRVARVILWIEADVVINRNPWEGLAGTRGVDAPWLVRPSRLPPFDVQYQWESPPCNGSWSSEQPGVVCRARRGEPHPEPLNCGQLLITSLSFARSVWNSRPARFVNSDQSQQHYANVAKHAFSHGGLSLDYYNHCWRSRVAIVDKCRMVTMHATCEQSFSGKATLMHASVHAFKKCALDNRTGRLKT